MLVFILASMQVCTWGDSVRASPGMQAYGRDMQVWSIAHERADHAVRSTTSTLGFCLVALMRLASASYAARHCWRHRSYLDPPKLAVPATKNGLSVRPAFSHRYLGCHLRSWIGKSLYAGRGGRVVHSNTSDVLARNWGGVTAVALSLDSCCAQYDWSRVKVLKRTGGRFVVSGRAV